MSDELIILLSIESSIFIPGEDSSEISGGEQGGEYFEVENVEERFRDGGRGFESAKGNCPIKLLMAELSEINCAEFIL